ncbi:cytochrome o ubiquinol oxidase subunit IV [Candidatus Saccharibacteria bacterium]|nr:cytochrome o ubiquinol oxidase subunit IV [Candidatus Saccharibacteria bacterium]
MNQANNHSNNSGSYLSYISGFLLSLTLTLIAFALTRRHLNSHHLSPSDSFMLGALAVLALIQLFVQLTFFLHLDRESKPWWNNTVFAFAAIVVIILVGGSIWIMANLDYHHGAQNKTHSGDVLHGSKQTNQYIIQDEGIKP